MNRDDPELAEAQRRSILTAQEEEQRRIVREDSEVEEAERISQEEAEVEEAVNDSLHEAEMAALLESALTAPRANPLDEPTKAGEEYSAPHGAILVEHRVDVETAFDDDPIIESDLEEETTKALISDYNIPQNSVCTENNTAGEPFVINGFAAQMIRIHNKDFLRLFTSGDYNACLVRSFGIPATNAKAKRILDDFNAAGRKIGIGEDRLLDTLAYAFHIRITVLRSAQTKDDELTSLRTIVNMPALRKFKHIFVYYDGNEHFEALIRFSRPNAIAFQLSKAMLASPVRQEVTACDKFGAEFPRRFTFDELECLDY
ncbi:MAG: hypothetical protein LBL99_00635 [Holosporaceae bacterium]|jgi:hypothetical protein|nr:hypothetical protein [Holosporaceae bacterium]